MWKDFCKSNGVTLSPLVYQHINQKLKLRNQARVLSIYLSSLQMKKMSLGTLLDMYPSNC